MRSLYVKERDQEGAPAEVVLAEDLLASYKRGERTLNLLVAEKADGPFVPFDAALEENRELAFNVARALKLKVAARFALARPAILFVLVPTLMLGELEREMFAAGLSASWVPLALDSFLAALLLTEGVRKIPHRPRIDAIVGIAVAARFAVFITRSCFHPHAAIALATAAAIVGSAVLSLYIPLHKRLLRDVRSELAIVERDHRETVPIVSGTNTAASLESTPLRGEFFVFALAGTAGLPLLLAAARVAHVPGIFQIAFFLGYAALVPSVVEGMFHQIASFRFPRLKRLISAIAFSFALAVGLTHTVHYVSDAVGHAAECLAPGANVSKVVQRFAQAEREEAKRAPVRESDIWWQILGSVILVPIAEERVYRSFFQRILRLRWSRAIAIVSSACLFGLSHFDVYLVVMYQTVLLGLAFGIAYEEAGIVAAITAHAIWNLHLL